MAANIVLVDDDEKIAELSGQSLISKGYEVEVFTNPTEAMEYILSHQEIEVVITDNIMPGLNGQELIENCYKNRPELKFILATGDDSSGIETEKYQGSVCIVAKPFKRKDLIAAIENFKN
ncbi:response regulator [Bacteriovorax sp. DB6_IX]|uniref:response regulator n=1 Tax=Bacteriovorax sp. DB6_IX TaxID=1353530 RepID=UPI00038A0B4B|nr:response regulator [Bacteriovorax sp. DB6_IX]EQC52043.1 response regulator receiver domain protein [Bacteriovorax sp. DB6_IX]